MAQQHSEVEKNAQWRTRCRSEKDAAKHFTSEWGFLTVHDEPAQASSSDHVPCCSAATYPDNDMALFCFLLQKREYAISPTK